MNPVDVTRTRYYNQQYVNGKGVQYSSGVHAAATIANTEGPLAFYRGFLTHFLRIGPHFCRMDFLTFTVYYVFSCANPNSHIRLSWNSKKERWRVLHIPGLKRRISVLGQGQGRAPEFHRNLTSHSTNPS